MAVITNSGPINGNVDFTQNQDLANNIELSQYNQANNPQLPAGSQITAQNVQDSPDMYQNTPGLQGDVSASTASAGQSQQVANPDPTQASSYQAQLTGYQNAAQGTASQVNQSQVGQTQAAQGQVDPNQLIETNYERLSHTDTNNNGIPDFAEASLRTADQQMAARGLGASSMAAEARSFAIMQSLIPMAQFDATQYSQMAQLNLNNRQQANLQNASQQFQAAMANMSADQQMSMQNLYNRQQVLLTDQAAENASLQFNAQNKQQNDQFMASLMTQIAQSNASRADAMNQFNAGQANALSQFNAQLQSQREQFNVENQRIIDQSNVQWRRSINTANTAAQNAAAQTNAQNLFNLSAQAQANLWQQFRDEASWANTAAENDKNRAQNLAVAAIQRDSYFQGLNTEEQNKMYEALGAFGLNMLNSFL